LAVSRFCRRLAPAEEHEAALQRVWDAVTASGTDDHILFVEYPELPEHWRRHSGSPTG
jgi:hypothetical protein